MTKIHVNMMSSADKVAGQGVGGAYAELMNLLENRAKSELKITKTLRAKNPDITHFHTIDPHFYLAAQFKKYTGRRIGYVHLIPDTLDGSLDMPAIAEKIVKKYLIKFYDKMDHLVVVNPDFKEELVKIGIDREKITYIPNFVAKDKWSPLSKEEREEFRKLQGWKKDEIVVFGVGQVQQRKGIDDFVKLAENNPDIKFLKNKEGKEIRLSPDSILITDNNGSSIEIKEGEGIHINSSGMVFIGAKTEVLIESSNSDIKLISPMSVQINQNGTQIEMSDGITSQGSKIYLG